MPVNSALPPEAAVARERDRRHRAEHGRGDRRDEGHPHRHPGGGSISGWFWNSAPYHWRREPAPHRHQPRGVEGSRGSGSGSECRGRPKPSVSDTTVERRETSPHRPSSRRRASASRNGARSARRSTISITIATAEASGQSRLEKNSLPQDAPDHQACPRPPSRSGDDELAHRGDEAEQRAGHPPPPPPPPDAGP